MAHEHPTADDWAGHRGERWLANLTRMEAMLAPVDEPLIAAMRLDAPLRVADVGCGGGGTTLKLARHAPTGSVIHGFDLSPALIESARARRADDQRFVSFARADVSTTAPPDGAYDRLVSRFGLMFFDDPRSAFRNLVGWLAPGGRFAFAVWADPSANPWMTSVREVVAAAVDVPPLEPDAPGPFRYADAHRFVRVLEEAGFDQVEVGDWCGALSIGGGLGPDAAAEFALAAMSIGDRLADADDATRRDAHRSLTQRFSLAARDGVVRLDARVHIVTGTRLR